MTVFLLVLGLILLVIGGDMLVRGAVGLAGRLGVSPLLIGLTVVGFGTSTPELVTSLQAAFAGAPGLALGNVVGSNIANILLILAVAALIRPFAVGRAALGRDGLAMVLATLGATALIATDGLGRAAGFGLVAGLGLYLLVAYRIDRNGNDSSEADPAVTDALGVSLALALGGILLTILGARLLVDSATEIAGALGVSDAVIGLTLVAVGTSLPELVTSVMAALRGRGDIALGNVLGSNIYNLLGVLGVTALVHPIPVAAQIARVDTWVMLAVTLLLVVLMRTGWRVSRREGGVLLIGYAGYLGWLAV
ncbi:calcium/sodium antiporter [Maritimibacter fusiformis]|uniref:Calcium/sodium antiporter n=1 Tax=Maritimibacter fusiformis TaxID=2603819 RepID=A0A5D0RR66_9RHOB|nr:calcium/sodium antiporter [Maritimibacter fusiformis]TYB83054.1 calcium/sodium antiporter [Maritimibacter fusiformis]